MAYIKIQYVFAMKDTQIVQNKKKTQKPFKSVMLNKPIFMIKLNKKHRLFNFQKSIYTTS